MKTAIDLAERGWVPDWLTRRGIRGLLKERMREIATDEHDQDAARLANELASGPIALNTAEANEQHYELPPRFFELVLGAHLKYSSAYWPSGTETLEDAEAAMLALTCERAGIRDGQTVLDLGCGWGSLSLWIARNYPRCRVTAVSNSSAQGEFIASRAAMFGLRNLRVITADMNDFAVNQEFDRVVSVEMFEHMRNYQQLLARIRRWLKTDGRLFVHMFVHRDKAYPFERDGRNDWMARHFFTGGMMPTETLLRQFNDDLRIEQRWCVNGRHYTRTLESWLSQLDHRRKEVLEVMCEVYGADEAQRWLNRWRMFFLACAELFAYRDGEEWFVGHFLLAPTRHG